MDNPNQTSQVPEAQSQMPSPVSKSNNTKLLIFILAGVAIVLAIGAYLLGAKQSQPVVQNNVQTTQIPSPTPDPTDDWKIFQNEKYGFKLKLPPGYELEGPDSESSSEYFVIRHLNDVPDFYLTIYKAGYDMKYDGPGFSEKDIFINGLSGKEIISTTTDSISGKEIKCNHYDFTTSSYIYQFHGYESCSLKGDNALKILNTFTIYNGVKADDLSVVKSWKTYRDEKYGFEFRYPQDSKMSKDESSIELPFNTGTNLAEKTLWITVKASTPANCSNPPTQTSEQPTTIRINNLEFKKEIGADAGAGNIYNQFNYSTARNSNCFGLSFVLHFSPPEMFSPVRPAFDREKEIKVFDQILSTFQFTTNSTSTSNNMRDEGSDGFILSNPNGGEVLNIGSTQTIKWNDSKGLADKIGIFIQDTKSIPWKTVTISTNVSSSQSSYAWTVPNDGSVTPGNKYKILITASIKGSTKMGLTDETDGVFEILK